WPPRPRAPRIAMPGSRRPRIVRSWRRGRTAGQPCDPGWWWSSARRLVGQGVLRSQGAHLGLLWTLRQRHGDAVDAPGDGPQQASHVAVPLDDVLQLPDTVTCRVGRLDRLTGQGMHGPRPDLLEVEVHGKIAQVLIIAADALRAGQREPCREVLEGFLSVEICLACT